MKDNMCYIYALTEPNGNLSPTKVRYIGKTCHSIQIRLNQHIKDSKKYKHYCANWIQSLLKNNLTPEVHLIVSVPKCSGGINEMYWIRYYRDLHSNLVNISDGGDGASLGNKNGMGNKSHLGLELSQTTKDKISQSLLGNKRAKDNHSWLGRKHSEESRVKMSQSKIGSKNPMWRGVS